VTKSEEHLLEVTPEVLGMAVSSVGAFFEPLSRIDRATLGAEHLDAAKAIGRAELLQRYVSLEGKKLLEIGSGFGTNIAAWIKYFRVDGWGLEADGEGFGNSFAASRKLLSDNGIDPSRIIAGIGEKLPFEDKSFDIVYSANVLEHAQDPQRVLLEAVRVLKPGGILHFEMPNYLSYFEGHYMILQPPIFFRGMLPLWVRLCRRDPTFAKTLQTAINPRWSRKTLARIGQSYPIQLLSLGEDVFLERLSHAFNFEKPTVAGKIGRLVTLLQRINRRNWVGRVIVALQGHYPIYMTVLRK
jgi:ubiquinone/menaquinone biosynthesis C-methylase UbiE